MSPSLPAASPDPASRLLVFDTHPIQYRAPVFQALSRRHASVKVYFLNAEFNGRRWWFHEVGKIPRQVWGRPLEQGYDNEILGTDRLGWRATLRRFSSILRAESPAAVAIYGYYLPEHWMLRYLCARLGIALIFIGETFAESRSPWRRWLKAPLLRYFFRGVSQVISIGTRNRDLYARRGVSPERLVSARYCVDTDFFRLSPQEHSLERGRWRSQESIPESALVILFVGRLFARKRPFDLFAIEAAIDPQLEVLIAIAGNGELENQVRERARGNRRIRLLGFRDQREVRSCYHGADALLVPSEYETWGLVVNEAFACGIPAIVTDTCGVAGDLVVGGETGFLYPVGDTAAAAEAISLWARDRERCRKMGQAAQAKVGAEYDADQFADAFLTALSRVRR
jgi:glycosyltransferase involved in cell wall biosynthesis